MQQQNVDIEKYFCNRLEILMRTHNKTANALAKETGLSQPTIVSYLRGTTSPRLREVVLIAKVFGEAPADMIAYYSSTGSNVSVKEAMKIVSTFVELTHH